MKKINVIVSTIFTLIISFTFLSLEKSNGQTNSSSSSSSGECIVCIQVVPNCSSNETLTPQTCNECAHCISTPPSSSSGSLSCTTSNDCPPGICSSSGTFKNYSCSNGKCNQIFYFADPCQFQSSSSGDLITLNKNFSGTWKARIPKSQGISSELICNPGCKTFCPDGKPDPSKCVCICESVNPEKCTCQNGKVVCNGCEPSCPPLYFDPICAQFTEKESFNGELKPVCCTSAGGGQYCPDRASCVIPLNTRVNSKIITLKLCVKDGRLFGRFLKIGRIKNGIITSEKIISENEVEVVVKDKKEGKEKLSLKLTDGKSILLTGIASGQSIEFKNRTSLKKCAAVGCLTQCSTSCCLEDESCTGGDIFGGLPFQCLSRDDSNTSSSSGETDCSPKGSCRGENGEELSCPPGTECSGLPAYGCYPTGCPVPICCSPDTRIRTDGVQKRIADIKKGELVISDDGKAVRVKKVSKTPVKNHKVLKITLNDATILEISPGHPTADGRKFKDLKMGDILDGRMVIETKLIPYIQSHTYDILPDSKSGNYYANGILIGSTLK